MNVTVYITHRRLSGGTEHKHITSVKWINPLTSEEGASSTEVMVDWIENKHNTAKVMVGKTTVTVGVVDHKYLRTHADGKWSNNLLSLPPF